MNRFIQNTKKFFVTKLVTANFDSNENNLIESEILNDPIDEVALKNLHKRVTGADLYDRPKAIEVPHSSTDFESQVKSDVKTAVQIIE